jgi:hypothetical protein
MALPHGSKKAALSGSTMRAHEFLREESSAGTTTAGAMAVVSQPLGGMITRQLSAKPAKYQNSAPVMKRKQHARG